MDPCKICYRLQWCLHGTVQIFRPVVIILCSFTFAKQPSKNMTRFQALTALSEQKVARFGCLHESVRNWNRAGQKVDLLFSGPKLAHLGPVYTGPDKFLYGRIFFLDRLSTGIRANSVTDFSGVYTGPCKFLGQPFLLCCFTFAKQPGKNIARFQALTALSEQKVARFVCLHESVRNRNRAGQKVDLLFSGPKLAHLAVQKFVQFRRSRVNARWNRASFCPCKNLSGPV